MYSTPLVHFLVSNLTVRVFYSVGAFLVLTLTVRVFYSVGAFFSIDSDDSGSAYSSASLETTFSLIFVCQ